MAIPDDEPFDGNHRENVGWKGLPEARLLSRRQVLPNRRLSKEACNRTELLGRIAVVDACDRGERLGRTLAARPTLVASWRARRARELSAQALPILPNRVHRVEVIRIELADRALSTNRLVLIAAVAVVIPAYTNARRDVELDDAVVRLRVLCEEYLVVDEAVLLRAALSLAAGDGELRREPGRNSRSR